MERFFDGIGTEIIGIIISLLVGAIGGGAVGYRIAIKRTTKQKQRAGNDSEQRQELQSTKEENDVHLSKNKTSAYCEANRPGLRSKTAAFRF